MRASNTPTAPTTSAIRACIALVLAAAAGNALCVEPPRPDAPCSESVIAGSAFKAGLAVRVITPAESMWMSGYAARNKPSEGKVHDLYVKALAFEDPKGNRLCLVTSDLVGFTRELTDPVAEEVRKRTGLTRDQLMVTASHTHCGPVVRASLTDMYDLTPEHAQKIKNYTEQLKGWMVEAVAAAAADLKPAQLTIGKGMARFAANRRQATPKGIVIGENQAGPVDHDVPVLRVETPDGKLRAIVFGYACHNTTLDFNQWCGDYAGFAQAYVEEKHAGAVAMFWSGCGADANPMPRRTLELCQKHGRELADAVEAVLQKPMTRVTGLLAGRYSAIELPFDTLPTKENLTADLVSKTVAVRQRAARLLKALEAGRKIDDHYRHYPVQVWRLGDELIWVALGGEVVVDYSLRLKRELGDKRPIWITAYANDVMAYIPSSRVLKEGGYEGDTSMVYYGMPTKWAPPVEEKIIAKVHELAKAVR